MLSVPLFTTDVNPVQPANALAPIIFTELGIVIEVKPVQFLNASSLIAVTVFGIIVVPLQPL